MLHGEQIGGFLGDGMIAGGGHVKQPLGLVGTYTAQPPLVVTARDIEGRLHWATTDERRGMAKIGRWPRRFRRWPTAGDVFRVAYPDVEVPPALELTDTVTDAE